MTSSTSTFPYTTANDLTEFTMIAGTNQEFTFDVFTSGCSLVNLSGGAVTWYLAIYGQSTATLTKAGVIAGSPVNRFSVYLTPADTLSLYGKYIQQYKAVDASGSTFRPSQGIINIVPALV